MASKRWEGGRALSPPRCNECYSVFFLIIWTTECPAHTHFAPVLQGGSTDWDPINLTRTSQALGVGNVFSFIRISLEYSCRMDTVLSNAYLVNFSLTRRLFASSDSNR